MTVVLGGFAQEIQNQRAIKPGVIDVLIGTEDLAAVTSGVEVTTGWYPVGTIVPGSMRHNAGKEMGGLDTGFPASNKMQWISKVDLQLSFVLQELTARTMELVLGSGATEYVYAATPAATYAKASPAPTVNGFDLNSATNYAENQEIEVTMDDGSKEVTWIKTLSTVTVTVEPPLSVAIIGGVANLVKAILAKKNAVGSVEIPRKALKLRFLDKHLDKVILHVPGFSSVGDGSIEWSDTKAATRFPVTAKAYGKNATWQGVSQSVCGFIYTLPYGVS